MVVRCKSFYAESRMVFAQRNSLLPKVSVCHLITRERIECLINVPICLCEIANCKIFYWVFPVIAASSLVCWCSSVLCYCFSLPPPFLSQDNVMPGHNNAAAPAKFDPIRMEGKKTQPTGKGDHAWIWDSRAPPKGVLFAKSRRAYQWLRF